MPEGVAVGGAVYNPDLTDANSKPEPDASAPRGYTWNRDARTWQPKKTGKVLHGAEEASGESPPRSADASSQDPEPAHMRDKQEKKRHTIKDVPTQVQNDMAGLMGLVGTPILAMLQSVDPYCGGALAANYSGVIDATLPLICRSEKIVKYFSEDQTDWLMWGKLALALAPVGRAILDHHVFHTVETTVDPTTGQRSYRAREANGQADHLTPPVQYDPSSYAA